MKPYHMWVKMQVKPDSAGVKQRCARVYVQSGPKTTLTARFERVLRWSLFRCVRPAQWPASVASVLVSVAWPGPMQTRKQQPVGPAYQAPCPMRAGTLDFFQVLFSFSCLKAGGCLSR